MNEWMNKIESGIKQNDGWKDEWMNEWMNKFESGIIQSNVNFPTVSLCTVYCLN